VITFKSQNTKKLSKETIIDICKIKDEHWSFGLKSQLKYFKKNIKSFDIHNLMYKNNELVGYTVFRIRKIFLRGEYKKYLLLDSIIIKKNYRKKNYGRLLMRYNNKFIRNKKMLSILFSTKNRSNFFRKYLWKMLYRKNCILLDHKLSEKIMYFNKFAIKFDKKDLLKIFVNK